MGIMAKATWEGAVLAESNATVEVEGNQYFPPDAIRKSISRRVRRIAFVRGKGRRITTIWK